MVNHEGFTLYAVTLANVKKALAQKEETNPVTKLPTQYHRFLNAFSRKDVDKLPPY